MQEKWYTEIISCQLIEHFVCVCLYVCVCAHACNMADKTIALEETSNDF